MPVGTRIRQTREQAVLSQENLAARSGVTVTTISRIENGHHAPRFSTVRNLAKALGVDPSWLLYGDQENEGQQSNGEEESQGTR